MSPSAPAQPVDAATVILIREPPDAPWQCFMVRRHVHSDFAPDVFVFPGGKVDPGDRDPELARWVEVGKRDEEPAEDSRALALRVAALRELFEEAGVLLAWRRGGRLLECVGPEEQRFSDYRRRLCSGDLSMLDLAQSEELHFAADLLHPFSHWITPEPFPRRYDTRFFLARLPGLQEPLHDAQETTDSVWINPAEALELYKRGGFPLVFATEKNLERLARYQSVQELLSSTTHADLQPIIPRMVQEGAETRFLIPGDDGY